MGDRWAGAEGWWRETHGAGGMREGGETGVVQG